jgi:hypothetical protein
MKISFRGEECGEWGGNSELIEIYRRQENKLIARLTIDTMICGKMQRYSIRKDSTEIFEDGEKRIVQYVHDVLDASFHRCSPSNAGEMYTVKIDGLNGASSLKISFYTYGCSTQNPDFKSLHKFLFK